MTRSRSPSAFSVRRAIGRVAIALSVVALAAAAPPPEPTTLVRPIASFTVTLMPPGKGEKPFGWIELRDGTGKASGFIYLEDSDDDPRIGGQGTYIVTHLPYQELSGTIALLQTVKPLEIRFAGGSRPAVFIEDARPATITPDVARAAGARRSM